MTILRGIPRIINPDLLRILARMGHGDELVLADANFPAASCAATTTHGVEIREWRRVARACRCSLHLRVCSLLLLARARAAQRGPPQLNRAAAHHPPHNRRARGAGYDTTGVPELLRAIVQLMPLDPVANAGIFMAMMPEHVAAGWRTPIWDEYKSIILEANGPTGFEEVRRARLAVWQRPRLMMMRMGLSAQRDLHGCSSRAARRAPARSCAGSPCARPRATERFHGRASARHANGARSCVRARGGGGSGSGGGGSGGGALSPARLTSASCSCAPSTADACTRPCLSAGRAHGLLRALQEGVCHRRDGRDGAVRQLDPKKGRHWNVQVGGAGVGWGEWGRAGSPPSPTASHTYSCPVR